MGQNEVKSSKPVVGTKYYRWIGNTCIYIRLLRVKNDNCYVVERNGVKSNMTAVEFKTFTRLNPDGYVGFCIAVLDENIRDVIVTFYRRKDMNSAEQEPYATCRMNTFDLYTNAIKRPEDERMYMGCSVSIDTCPENVDYKIMRACNGMDSFDLVAIYFEDNLDSIMSLINPVNYDSVLYILNSAMDKTLVAGGVNTLKELLQLSYFMDDVYRGFNILKMEFTYIDKLTDILIHAIEDVLKVEMLDPVWIKFDRDINLKDIKDKYVIIKDARDDIYIISYAEGDYTNRPYVNMGDDTEVETLKCLANNRLERARSVMDQKR